VAYLDTANALSWLDRAAKEQWSRDDLREQVRSPAPPDFATVLERAVASIIKAAQRACDPEFAETHVAPHTTALQAAAKAWRAR
jgi:hypothetical protein